MKQIVGTNVNSILKRSLENNLQIPEFQRNFKWSEAQICSLLESAMQGLPCGSLVLWSNSGYSNMSMSELIPIRLSSYKTREENFVDWPYKPKQKGNEPFIVIDGLQRITAIACGFGGLSTKGASKYVNGKFFIDVTKEDIQGSVLFLSSKKIKDKSLDNESKYKEEGLYPLSSYTKPKSGGLSKHSNIWSDHWDDMRDMIKDTKNKKWIKKAKLIDRTTKDEIMGEMQIENTVSLAEVAEAFELLNTKGTSVNHVDIIHSNLNTWTRANNKKRLKLRDWFKKIGNDKNKKTFGWVGKETHYKMLCQMIIATELSAKNRKPGRKNHKQPVGISVKDQMSLTEGHWLEVKKNEAIFQDSIASFQTAILGQGRFFPYEECPYPISSCIYIGLYYKYHNENCSWQINRLNETYRAFFWKNALSKRYSVDSLKVPEDMMNILSILEETENEKNKVWKKEVNDWLNNEVLGPENYNLNDYEDFLLGEKILTGDLKKAIELPINRYPKKSIFNNSNITYPKDIDKRQIHHIFPRKWIKSNSTRNVWGNWHDSSKKTIGIRKECLANKTPLSSTDNQKWWDDSPGTVIQSHLTKRRHRNNKDIWKERFIDSAAYSDLSNDNPVHFLERRAETIAQWLISQTTL